jgi:hypothetical protein
MTIPIWFEVAFWSIAIIVSAFLGLFCFQIHGVRVNNWAAKAHQVWFNFAGALAGWVALWFLLRQWWGIWDLPASTFHVTVSDFGLALTAYIGISGYLPYTVVGAIQAFVAVVQTVIRRISDLLSTPF